MLNDIYQALDPIAFQIGPIAIRWYGLAYIVGFIAAGFIIYRRAKRWGLDITADDVFSMMIFIAFGVIIGGRLGYVLFYGIADYLKNPLEIFAINHGGMSFHGGLVGAIVGGILACRKIGLSPATMADLGAGAAPVGLFLGRIANFINGELWGKETDLPWGVVFEVGGNPRHPSQLYEALLEGLVMFVVLWWLSRKIPPRPQFFFIGTFLCLYGVFRFAIEFVRVPDAQLGYLFGFVTMGQVLSLPLIIGGGVLVYLSLKWNRPQVGLLEDEPGEE